METKRLYRSAKDRMLGGVAGGIADYFGIDSTLVRLLFVLLTISGGAGVVVYIIAWVIIPEEPSMKSGKSGAEEIKEQAEKVASEVREAVKKNPEARNDFRFWMGLLILLFGLALLVQLTLGYSFFRLLWPAAIIAVGSLVIVNSMRK